MIITIKFKTVSINWLNNIISCGKNDINLTPFYYLHPYRTKRPTSVSVRVLTKINEIIKDAES